jgi:signal transduction histidine kinase
MTEGQSISLERYLRSQAARWALIGFVVTVFLAIPCVLYSAKLASERQLLVATKSAARAFRPMILEDDTRDAEFQMRNALELKDGESAVVRDPALNAVYPIEEGDKIARCNKPNSFCWAPGFHKVSLLYPIYFDSQKPKVLYGYLELTMRPTLDWATLSILVFLLLVAFIGQAFGLSSALTQSARQIVAQLSSWAEHLRKNPGERPEEHLAVPFTELRSMQEAVDGLYLEIEKLREQTAREAKTEGQFSLLREISHDLKTPHSLLAKYFAIHLDTLRTTGEADPHEVAKINNTLKRMGELLRQVRVIPLGQTIGALGTATALCDIGTEARSIVEDIQNDPEVESKRVVIEGRFPMAGQAAANISPIALYRVLENLVRNAIEAVEPERGRINITVDVIAGSPTLTVTDNGCGIAHGIRDKILAFDFTTKPARGTGLGLGIVDKICKEFDATLRFDSIEGRGTTFTVTFKPAAGVAGRSPENFKGVTHVQI